jgi:hypothetical protein
MTIYQSKLGRGRFLKEPAFGTDGSGTAGDYFDAPFIEGSDVLDLVEPVETPGHAQQRVDGYPLGLLMPKFGSTLSLSYNFGTATTKATSTVQSTHSWFTRLMEIAFGSYHQSTGSLFSAGWNTTTGDVSVGTTLRPGSAIGWVNTNGQLECREIQTNDGSNTLLTKLAFSGSPANTNIAYGCTTAFPSPREVGVGASIQYLWEGWNVEDRFLLKGGWLDSLTLSINPAGIARVTFKWMFADWDRADGAATAGDFTGAVLGAATYINTQDLVVMDSEFRAVTVATSTLTDTLYHPSEITIEFPGLIRSVPRTPAGIQTGLGPVRTHQAPVARGSFTLPYEDNNEWWTAKTARTAKYLAYQIGTSISVGAVLLSVPNAQIVNVQKLDVGGVLNQKVDWVARLEADCTAESGYEGLGEAAFRMHCF